MRNGGRIRVDDWRIFGKDTKKLQKILQFFLDFLKSLFLYLGRERAYTLVNGDNSSTHYILDS